MAFFLGISMISILECVCYFFYRLKKCCCRCIDNTNEDDAENIEQFQITPNGDLRVKQRWKKYIHSTISISPFINVLKCDIN